MSESLQARQPHGIDGAHLVTAPGFSPVMMLEVELTQPLPALPPDGECQRAWVLARLHTEPVGVCMLAIADEGLTSEEVAAALWGEMREAVQDRYRAFGLRCPEVLPGAGLGGVADEWPFLRRRAEVLTEAPFISVVVCTKDRAEQLRSCLGCLQGQQYPRFEVVVVDNAPGGDAVPRAVSAWQSAMPCRYVAEPRGGLSWARNTGAAAAVGEIVAFLDDDEEPDRHWLAGLALGFAQAGDIGAVTGIILPARLDTPAQELFELAGGHSLDRGFTAAVFASDGPQSPLFPLPPFGAGGNMAFRREALARIGWFDVALGAGTPARGGEDSFALTMTLLAGYRIAYEPAAFVRHNHFTDFESLARLWHGYGIGLTAFYAALVRHRPSVLPQLIRLLPDAVRYLRPGNSDHEGAMSLPITIRRRKRQGMISGPMAYVRSMRRQARLAAASAGTPEVAR